jgi:LEA14-like dessication related protein
MFPTRFSSAPTTHGRRPSIARAVLLALCLPLAGCSIVTRIAGGFEDPTVELEASKVASISLSAAQLLFTLRVHNPNARALQPQGLRYRLTVNQTMLAEGATDASVTVPPRASAPLNLRVDVPLKALLDTAPGAMTLGEIPYELEVWLSVDSWFRQHEVRLVASSVLRLNLPLGLARVVAFPDGGWQS